jgi:penicillin-binding protein 2
MSDVPATKNGSPTLHNNLITWRMLVFCGIAVGALLIFAIRLFNLQIIQGADYRIKADDNRTNIINLPAPRGIIYDRNGYMLARNIAAYNIVITPSDLPDDPGEVQNIYRSLSRLIDLPVSQGVLDPKTDPYVPCKSHHGISQIVAYGETTAPYSPVRIKCDVSRTVAMIVQEKSVDWPGVGITTDPVRDYPTGSLTAEFIGYLGPIYAEVEKQYKALGFDVNRDKIGYAGVEKMFQEQLAGKNGLRVVEWDAAGKVLRDLQPPQPETPGDNIQLTIDTRYQQAVESIIKDELDYWNKYFIDKPSRQMTSAVAIAMNPKTGEILAMVSYPTYENNRLARLIPEYYYNQLVEDARKPLLNHAVGDQLPAGSVFKLSTAVGSLNEGIVTPDKIIKTPGVLYITEKSAPNDPGRQRRFVDWNWQTGGFGQLDFLHCISNSSNVCFYKLGGGYQDEIPEGLGICRLGTYARALGYGEKPGTGLPEETGGLIPDPEWKRTTQGESWTIGDTYISSVGQGYVLAVPLQVLMSVATIANNGKLMQPTLLREVIDSQGSIVQPFQPKTRWDLTKDPLIDEYNSEYTLTGCEKTGNKKTVQPWVFQAVQQGMRLAVLEGTLSSNSKVGFDRLNIAVAGKTGTAEYCDQYARVYSTCEPGNWPTHGWTVAYAPYDDPEIAIVAFVYNGGEGASSAAPIVRRMLQSYFEFKAIDNAAQASK